ncbi:MAG TPA: ABC transporter substrate-binding protein [Tissierella sp.]|uniref:ABC transporter substrate-binding protein n=1 Tax=Tissierella praeacuta TaxID=43131 RepID=UPI000ECDF9E3|nr:ABC transporter substrate-binding protein [Tissierella praeacuta]HAE92858.1 ABC transporter substrate-binding protein [Tissierella sp.]
MRNRKWLILLLALVILSSTACGNKKTIEEPSSSDTSKDVAQEPAVPQKVDGGIFMLGIGSDPNVMNPLYAGDRVTMTINNAIFSPLYVIDEEGTHFYLAESITPSEDYLTYTLKLKSGLKWHDGEDLNADDIVFTINSITDEKQRANARGSFIIDGKPVEPKKIDDLTVEIILPKISVPFIDVLGELRPIPEHIFKGEEDLAKSTKNLEPIGSGPFKFKEMKSGEKVELVRFDEYFDGKANLESIVFRVIADPNAANTALLNGELSARYITTADVDKFKADENFNVVLYKEGMLNNMVFRLTNKSLQNKDVRKAIAYGINKDELITGVYKSAEYAEKAYSVFVPSTQFYTDDVEKYDYNVERAKELLKNAGVENLKLRLAYINSSKENEGFALIMQQQLKEIGIELELLPMERGAFYDKLLDASNTDFDLAFNGYVMGVEPNGYKPLFKEKDYNNFMGYVNKELDKKWEEGVIETDKAKRAEIYKTIQKQLIEDMVVYPIAYPNSIVAVNKKYGGIEEAKPAPIFMFRDLSKLYIME